MQTVKTKAIVDERLLTEEDKLNPGLANSSDLIKIMLNKFNIQKTGQLLPLVLFLNGRLYHGTDLLDSTNSVVSSMKDIINLDQSEFYFPNWTIDALPLEARVVIVISAVYNNSYLKKLCFVSFSVFDSFGVLRTGPRVGSRLNRNYRCGY